MRTNYITKKLIADVLSTHLSEKYCIDMTQYKLTIVKVKVSTSNRYYFASAKNKHGKLIEGQLCCEWDKGVFNISFLDDHFILRSDSQCTK